MISCVIELKIFPASKGQTFWGKSRSFIIVCVQFLLINHHFHPTVKGVVSLPTFFFAKVTFTKWRNYRNWCYHFVLWYILRSFCCVNSFVKWIGYEGHFLLLHYSFWSWLIRMHFFYWSKWHLCFWYYFYLWREIRNDNSLSLKEIPGKLSCG